MKICGKCKIEKNEFEFNKNKCRKDGLNTNCRECMKLICRDHYSKNKKHIVKLTARLKRKRIVECKKVFLEFKSQGCFVCNEKETCCIDAHHLDPKQKEFEVSKGIHNIASKDRIEKELIKCIPLCANCHRKFHAGKIQLGARRLELRTPV